MAGMIFKDTRLNRGVMVVIAIAVVGMFAIMVMNANEKTSAEKIGNSISKAVDDAADNMD